MCGIVGIINKNNMGCKARTNYFTEALYADAVRGWDSTGLYAVNRQNRTKVCKRAFTAWDFMNMKTFDKLIKDYATYKYLIGHNRKATKGGVSHENAHPFDIGSVVMVHNGTLDNHKSLPEGNKFVVDSEAFTNSMNKIGARDTLERVEGAFAVVWYDRNDDTVSICRNTERPLSYAYVDGGVLIASEKLMLMWLAKRNSLQLQEVFDLPPGEIITFNDKDPHSPKKEKITLFVPKHFQKWMGNGYQWDDDFYTPPKKDVKNPAASNSKRPAANDSSKPAIIVDTKGNATQRALKQRDAVIAKRCIYHGVKVGETMAIDSCGFIPYESQTTKREAGYIQGLYMNTNGDLILVEMHGHYEDQWVADGIYQGKLSSIRVGNKPDQDTLVVVEAKLLKKLGEKEKEVKETFIKGRGKAVPPKTQDKASSSDSKEDVTDGARPRFRGPSGRPISEEAFESLVEDGCQHCSCPITVDMADEIRWINPGHGEGASCGDCAEVYKDSGVFIETVH